MIKLHRISCEDQNATERVAALGSQLHVSRAHSHANHMISSEEMTPIDNDHVPLFWYFLGKPCGGFWTSSLIDDEWSDWLEYTKGGLRGAAKYILTPEADAKVYTIHTEADYDKLLAMYPRTYQETISGPKHAVVDWGSMAEEWDGVHFSSSARDEIESRYNEADQHPLLAWCCESTCWFNWKFEDIEEVRASDSDSRQRREVA